MIISKHHVNLDMAVFAPVVLVLLVTGAGSYILLDRVSEYVGRSIRESLLSMSDGLYGVADLAFDELDRRGYARNRVETKLSQLSVFMRFEDFARQNDIGLIVRSGANPAADHQIKVSSQMARTLVGAPASPDGRAISVDGRTFHILTREFLPWDWQLTLVRDAAAFAVLEERDRAAYLVTVAVVLLLLVALLLYLRRAIARPVGGIVTRLRAREAPDYKGIREFEFLSDEIAQLMVFRDEHEENLDRQVKERTAELAEAKGQRDDAIENSPGAFSLYDAADRLAVFNAKYARLYPGMEDVVVPGSTFETIITGAVERGIISDALDDPDTWIQRRISTRREQAGPLTRRRSDGRWLQIDERRSEDGGTVAWYTDITELKKLNELKDAYVATAAHDLKGPLASIRNALEKLLDGKLRDSRREKILRSLPEAADHLLAIITDLLEDSMLDPDNPRLVLHEANLSQLIRDQVALAESRAEQWDIDLVVELEPVRDTLLDAGRIRRVVDNLLSNALKFSKSGTAIHVGCAQVDDSLVMVVRDEGQGMSPEDLEKLWQPFEELSSRPLHGETSTGLGSSIIKTFVEAHGGEIDVSSEVGKGTTFTVRLPARKPTA